MKIQEQVFCKCGRGRAFYQANDAKRRAMRGLMEWVESLTRDGWRGVDLQRQFASKCNNCK